MNIAKRMPVITPYLFRVPSMGLLLSSPVQTAAEKFYFHDKIISENKKKIATA